MHNKYKTFQDSFAPWARSRKGAGFTLLELLVVIVIIGTIAGVITVYLTGATDSAKIAKGKSFAGQLHSRLGFYSKGWWNFNENASGTAPGGKDIWDYSGYGNHGTIGGNPQWVKSQIEGYALSFDGENDYVGIGDQSALESMSALTITAWIKTTVTAGARGIVTKWWGGATSYALRLKGTDPSKVQISTYTPAIVYSESTTSINDGKWHYIVATYDGTNQRLYVDGILEDTDAQSGTIANSEEPVCIGIFCDAGYANIGSFFNGLIDEVRIYAAALPSAEIQKHYVQGLNKLLANNAISEQEYDQRISQFNHQIANR